MKQPGKITFLFLGGAKRVGMAQLFSRAAQAEGYEARFVAYELNKNCAIASMAEVVEGLRWSDPKLKQHLEKVVRDYDVDVVIPFVDAAVAVATELAELCPGLFTPGEDALLQNKLFDKVESAKLFESHGLPIPRTFTGDAADKCWIAKPRFGSASKGLVYLSPEEVLNFDNSDENYLIQECFPEHEEISVDCYVDSTAVENPIISPRVRLEVMGGEAIKTLTIKDSEVEALAAQILSKLRLKGAVTIQFLRDRITGRLMVMEINPRLGGACTASILAGADIPRAIIRMASGLPFIHLKPKPDVLVCRYLTDVVINNNE